jgi:hypothetical protein
MRIVQNFPRAEPGEQASRAYICFPMEPVSVIFPHTAYVHCVLARAVLVVVCYRFVLTRVTLFALFLCRRVRVHAFSCVLELACRLGYYVWKHWMSAYPRAAGDHTFITWPQVAVADMSQ